MKLIIWMFFGRYDRQSCRHTRREISCLDEDTSGKAKFTVSTTGISRVMLENIKETDAIGGDILKP